MPIRCPNCGADNRDTAKVCNTCGFRPLQPPVLPPQSGFGSPQHLPRPQPQLPPQVPQVWPPPGPPAPGPGVGPGRPVYQPPAPGRLDWLTGTGFIVHGLVQSASERRDLSPTDWGKVAFSLGIGVIVVPPILGALISFFAGMAAVIVLLTICGLGSLTICIAPFIGLPFIMWGAMRREKRVEVPILDLRVWDPDTHQTINAELVGRRRGGSLAQGDEVEVWGGWTGGPGSGTARAWKVCVLRTVVGPGPASAAGATIRADRPFPWIVALAMLAVAAFVFVVAYLPLLRGVIR
jgi:hypothetical protein